MVFPVLLAAAPIVAFIGNTLATTKRSSSETPRQLAVPARNGGREVRASYADRVKANAWMKISPAHPHRAEQPE